jgi:predicted GH43/DUF377 family glycosyl hydrolase
MSTRLNSLVLLTSLLLNVPSSAFLDNCSFFPKQSDYTVTVIQRAAAPFGSSLISLKNGTSDFNFSFTTAWFPYKTTQDGLIVRVVECNPNHHSCAGVLHPEWTNAGALTVVNAVLNSNEPLTSDKVTIDNVTWMGTDAPPSSNISKWGFADPRAVYRNSNDLLYVTFDNCTQNCYPTRTTMLATSSDPFNQSSWIFHGPLLGAHAPYTGGASLLFRDDEPNSPPHLAFIGDSDTANAIWLAESIDGLNWTVVNKTWMLSRPLCWDHYGVAPAGQPSRLSNGNYLFIYNIDTGFPYHPNPLGRCAVGWAILDGNNPSSIIARSEEPLLVPVLPYETCVNFEPCQQPMVVFSTGLKPLGGDEFLILYGGGDSVVGVSRIFVNVTISTILQ